jgi:hypothetical protein
MDAAPDATTFEVTFSPCEPPEGKTGDYFATECSVGCVMRKTTKPCAARARHGAKHPGMRLAPLTGGGGPAAAKHRVSSNEMRDQLRLICDAAAGLVLADHCFYTFDRLPTIKRQYHYMVALKGSYDRLYAQGKVPLSLKEALCVFPSTHPPPSGSSSSAAGTVASGGGEEEVTVVGERSWQERDAELRRNAIVLED